MQIGRGDREQLEEEAGRKAGVGGVNSSLCAPGKQLQPLQGLAKHWEKPKVLAEPCRKQSCPAAAGEQKWW